VQTQVEHKGRTEKGASSESKFQVSNRQPQPEPGKFYYQLFAQLPGKVFGPATTAAILSELDSDRRLVWFGEVKRAGKQPEYIAYADDGERLVEVKFPAYETRNGWLHVSCTYRLVADDVFDAILATISETTMALENDKPF